MNLSSCLKLSGLGVISVILLLAVLFRLEPPYPERWELLDIEELFFEYDQNVIQKLDVQRDLDIGRIVVYGKYVDEYFYGSEFLSHLKINSEEALKEKLQSTHIETKVNFLPDKRSAAATYRFKIVNRIRMLIERLAPGRVKMKDFAHAELIGSLDSKMFDYGKKLYHTPGSCVTCHGTPEQAGTLPTSLKFWQESFRRGNRPHEMFQTLSEGFGSMPGQTHLAVKEKYAVIHYIREAFVKDQNPSQYFAVSDAYLKSLGEEQVPAKMFELRKPELQKPYHKMDFGPSLQATYQINDATELALQNIAQKAVAVRLDPGPGGVSKGNSWALFEHDLMTLSAIWEKDDNSPGRFVDWRGIAWDGSHGTHTSIVGRKIVTNPNLPGWANPDSGTFQDARFIGRDGRRFGPLPRSWMHYLGLYKANGQVLLHYTVGAAEVYEHHELSAPHIYSRILNVSNVSKKLIMRVAPAENISVALFPHSAGTLSKQVIDPNGEPFYVLTLEPSGAKQAVQILLSQEPMESLRQFAGTVSAVPDLSELMKAGSPQWPQKITTKITSLEKSKASSSYVVDTLSLPLNDPWSTWLRLGGFDFFPGGDTAAVATWNGDVWLVSGILSATQDLVWQRIASGLYQPLGVKVVDNTIYVTCRDQIVRLHDTNGDGEIDWYENFNSDHQVTENFHEFAMGLQTDAAGNFYYAKSARHGQEALVEHHGTLIRVSKDGLQSKVIANGFRAANGICLNDDGSFFVTDQEGHWMPGNRINRVVEGKYYGNHFSYHDKPTSDDAYIEKPLLWITNQIDRSPAELLWVKSDRWGPLKGMLLSLSYGEGKTFVVPHQQVGSTWQAAYTELPIPKFPTGIMRGRFNDQDGQLYMAGLFVWSSSASQETGGFFRVRYVGDKATSGQSPQYLPIGWRIDGKTVHIGFTDPLDPETINHPEKISVALADLLRSSEYGSDRLNVRKLDVESMTLSPDRKTLSIQLPRLEPAWLLELDIELVAPDGSLVKRKIHSTIHGENGSF